MSNFGATIKKLRERNKLTQTELAQVLNISKSMVSSYETGQRSPSYDVLIKIARFFNVSMDYLYGFKSDMYVSIEGLEEKEKQMVRNLIEIFRER